MTTPTSNGGEAQPSLSQPPTMAVWLRCVYISIGAAAGGLVALVFFNSPGTVPSWLAVSVGILTSSIELLKKYSAGTAVRTLLKCPWTWAYLVVNAGMSWAAFWVLRDSGLVTEGAVTSHGMHSPILLSLVAGLGAMMVLRSSVITIRTHGHDYPVGPALLLDALQEQIEHRIDQARAAESFEEVSRLMAGVSATPTGVEIASLALHALERLRPEAQLALKAEIKQLLKNKELTARGKAIAVGISVRKVAGLEVLQKVVAEVGREGASVALGTVAATGGQKDEEFRNQVLSAVSEIPG